jgi:hypothetical protein
MVVGVVDDDVGMDSWIWYCVWSGVGVMENQKLIMYGGCE